LPEKSVHPEPVEGQRLSKGRAAKYLTKRGASPVAEQFKLLDMAMPALQQAQGKRFFERC